ncbi:MAG: hypothetical protein ACLPR9_09960 [Acidimicrobiales bacterium]
MAKEVFPGGGLDRPFLRDYLASRRRAMVDHASTMDLVRPVGGLEAVADWLAMSFNVSPIELGAPEGIAPTRVMLRTSDPRQTSPRAHNRRVVHDRFVFRRPIINGDRELLRRWPSERLVQPALTTYDDDYVYLTWNHPLVDHNDRVTAIMRQHMQYLDAVLHASAAQIAIWQAELRPTALASVQQRTETLDLAGKVYESLGATAPPA